MKIHLLLFLKNLTTLYIFQSAKYNLNAKPMQSNHTRILDETILPEI